MFASLCLQLAPWVQYATEVHELQIATCIVNGLCSIVTVTCNLVIILAIVRNSSLRTPSYVLLCNLAISDLGVGIIAQPLYIALSAVQQKREIALSCKLHVAYISIAISFVWHSFVTLTAISVDRFLAVYLAVKYRSIVAFKKAKLVVLFLWITDVIIGMIFVLDMTVHSAITGIVSAFCLLLTSGNYIAIRRMLQRHNGLIQSRNHIQTGQQQRNTFNTGRYKKTVTTMLHVYGAFLLCYVPYMGYFLVVKLIGHARVVHEVKLISSTIVLSNSALNPFLYYWRIPELRMHINLLLRCGARKKISQK